MAAALADEDADALAESAAALPKPMRKAVASHRKVTIGAAGDDAAARQALERALGQG